MNLVTVKIDLKGKHNVIFHISTIEKESEDAYIISDGIKTYIFNKIELGSVAKEESRGSLSYSYSFITNETGRTSIETSEHARRAVQLIYDKLENDLIRYKRNLDDCMKNFTARYYRRK